MHNHTAMSDGDGDPDLAFASMRDAGLDVAALTDHATLLSIKGLSSEEWDRTGQLADAANDPGAYTAIRGFEWSHPLHGHANVWFTDEWVDLGGAGSPGSLYSWLQDRDAVASFNHPGRESGMFDNFSFSAGVLEKMVGLEMFNRGDDYLFDGWSKTGRSPLVACLNVGWRTGLTGVTDEHGTDWGFPEGKGRSGLWVNENTRAGVFEAMRARRFFATRVSGLRLDAVANGVQMGGTLGLASGDVQFSGRPRPWPRVGGQAPQHPGPAPGFGCPGCRGRHRDPVQQVDDVHRAAERGRRQLGRPAHLRPGTGQPLAGSLGAPVQRLGRGVLEPVVAPGVTRAPVVDPARGRPPCLGGPPEASFRRPVHGPSTARSRRPLAGLDAPDSRPARDDACP